jgi:Zn-finger nucleic acid-binding protein
MLRSDNNAMNAVACPRCRVELEQIATPGGLIHRCRTCSGQAFTASVAGRTTTPHVVTALLVAASSNSGTSGVECPWCSRTMVVVCVDAKAATTGIDVCASCQLFWLDAGEVDRLPSTTSPFVEQPRIAVHHCQYCGAPSRPDLDAYCTYCQHPVAPVRTPLVTMPSVDLRPRPTDPDENRSDLTKGLDVVAAIVRALLKS